jgi:hypothetical protein
LTYSADGGWTVYDSIQFNFQPSVFFGGVSPLLYSRGKHFSFFAGASIAVGAVTMALTENRFTSDPMNNINESFIENPKFKSTAFGLNPIIGFNIPLKKSRLPYGEIEISGAMNRWLKPFFTEARSFRPTDYRYFHLQLAYRYNFK